MLAGPPEREAPMQIRSVGVCLKSGRPGAAGTVRGLHKWLVERGLRPWLDEEAGECVGATGHARTEVATQVDLLLALRGSAPCPSWGSTWGRWASSRR